MNNISKDNTPAEAAEIFSKTYQDKGYKLQALHPYNETNGKTLFWRLRLKNLETGNKKILPMHVQNDGSYSLTEPHLAAGTKPLYNLNGVKDSPHETVWVTEGESCTDALTALGCTATTSGGATSAKKADWSQLKNREIVIWPDNDEAGFNYATQVTEILLKQNCNVKWVDVKKLELATRGDCVDWINSNPNMTKLNVQQLPLIEPPTAYVNISIPYPRFELKSDGVYHCKDANNATWICSWLAITALTRDANNINWGRVLVFRDADGFERKWTMPMELLGGHGEELGRELLRLGLRISPGGHARKLLVEYITNADTDRRSRCVLKTGWHAGCFVLPTKVFGNLNETVLFQSDSHASPDYNALGDLSDWKENIASKCVGNSRLTFAASLAFAAPLLNIVRGESGGFHFRGESSTGKTTALLIAASVWGGKNYVQNWRATDNGLEGLAAQHNDALLILDELSQIDPRYAGEVAYMLANGQGKARAAKSGCAKSRLNWQLLFLSSGEISLSSHMLEAGKKSKAGQEVRMIDIPADAGSGNGIFENLHSYADGAIFSETLKTSCDKFHGTPSEKFIEQLVNHEPLALFTLIQKFQNEFMLAVQASSHGQVKRAAQRFALVAAGGELASLYGITGWPQGHASHAVKKCFDAWLGTRAGGVGSHEHETILEQVRHFFEENAARFDTYEDSLHPIPHRRAGFKSGNGDFYVYTETFRNEICKGLGSSKDVAQLMIKLGWLMPDKTGTTYTSVWVPKVSRTSRLYHFNGNVIGDKERPII